MEAINGKNLNEICHVCTENDEELMEFKPLWYEIYHNFIGVFEENFNNLPYNICKKCKSYFESIVSLANKCKTNEIRLEKTVTSSRDLWTKKNYHQICRICLEHDRIINECSPNLYEFYKHLAIKKPSNDVLNLCAECKSYLQLIVSVISKWKLNKSVLEKNSYSTPQLVQQPDLEMKEENIDIEYNDLIKQEIAEACTTLEKILQAGNESTTNGGKEHISNIQQAQNLELSDKACYKNGEENVENSNFLNNNLDLENQEASIQLQDLPNACVEDESSSLEEYEKIHLQNRQMLMKSQELVQNASAEVKSSSLEDYERFHLQNRLMLMKSQELVQNSCAEDKSSSLENDEEIHTQKQQTLMESQELEKSCIEDKNNSSKDYEENHLQNTEMPKEFNIKNIEKDENEVESNPLMKESEKPENKCNSRKFQQNTCLEKPHNRYNLRRPNLINQQQLTAVTLCEHCQKPISSKRGFTKHVACIIREENKFECFTCGKFLASKSSLVNHDKRLHKRLKRD